jgi:hypothetical protein
MKVISRTLPALAMGAGLVTMPAMGTARAVPMTRDVHLVTLIQTLSHTPAAVRYAVSVRPVGGPAHAATLVLSTRKPAAWTAPVPQCLANRDRTALACDLGELRESESRTLRVTGRPGERGPAVVPVVAQAGAANAPSVTSSLGVMRSQALRLARPGDDPPPGQGSPGQDGDLAQSPEAQVSPGESPPAESPAAEAAPSEPAESPEIVSPAIRPRGADPQGRAPVAPPRPRIAGPARPARPAHPARPVAPRKAPVVPPAAAAPAPAAVPEPAPMPGVPQTPIIPNMPEVPPAVEGPASAGPIAGPAVPLPGASPPAALPQIAPKTSPGEGISELNTLSPAGAMQAGRTSWATLIAVAVVAEAGLLWLVAGLTVWRRRREGKGAPRALVRSPGRSPRPLQGRVLR